MAAASSQKISRDVLMKRKSTGAINEGSSCVHRGGGGSRSRLSQQQENEAKSLKNQVEQLKFALKSAHDEIDELTKVVHLLHNENESLVGEIDTLSKHHKLLQVKCFKKMQREEKFCHEYNSIVKYTSRKRVSPRKGKTSAVLAALQGLTGNGETNNDTGDAGQQQRGRRSSGDDVPGRSSNKKGMSKPKGSIRKTWHGTHKDMLRAKQKLEEAEAMAKSEHALSISARTEEETVVQDDEVEETKDSLGDVIQVAEIYDESTTTTTASQSHHGSSASTIKKSNEERVRSQRRRKRAQRQLNHTWHGSCCGSVKSTSSTTTTELLRLGAGSTRRLMHEDDGDSIGSMSGDDGYEGFAYRH